MGLVEHWEIKIAVEGEKERGERDVMKFSRIVKNFFIQMDGASTGEIHTRNNKQNRVGGCHVRRQNYGP